MCGIVALIGHREAASQILHGLRKLEYRGYDSAGLAVIKNLNGENGEICCKKSQGKLNNLSKLVDFDRPKGKVGIGHTRWATHGKPNENNAHPHTDSLGEIAVVQNGIIENHTSLRKQLTADGIKFSSETDTEVIPHLIAREIALRKPTKNDVLSEVLLKAVQKVLLQVEGSYALAVIWARAPEALVIAKNQAPLIIGFGEGEFICASDTPAFEGFTRTILPMEDGEIALLSPLGIELYDSKNNRQKRSPSLIKSNEVEISKSNFRHFMLKEIHEQPYTAECWIHRYFPNGLEETNPIDLPFEDSFYKSTDNIQILACGTSRHASMVGAYLLEQFAGVPTSVFYASEFRYAPPPLKPRTLTIGVTQSGETADTLAALSMDAQRRKQSKEFDYLPRQLGITNRPESSLSRQVDFILDIDAGIEVGVAATKTFLAQLLSFYALTIGFASKRKSRSLNEILLLIDELKKIPEHLKELLKSHSEVAKLLAHQFSNVNDAIFLGRGINYPIALEGALKLKEISYIHAEGYPAGEMKHGPIALIDKQVPVIAIASKGIVFEKVISNAQEAKARDARLIGIGPKDQQMDIFENLFVTPQVSEWISPIINVLPTQLLSYHIASHRGLDIDQPRNLAKSVTVE